MQLMCSIQCCMPMSQNPDWMKDVNADGIKNLCNTMSVLIDYERRSTNLKYAAVFAAASLACEIMHLRADWTSVLLGVAFLGSCREAIIDLQMMDSAAEILGRPSDPDHLEIYSLLRGVVAEGKKRIAMLCASQQWGEIATLAARDAGIAIQRK